jgi:hypothetical protein
MRDADATPAESEPLGCSPRGERKARSMTTALDYANATESRLDRLSANQADAAPSCTTAAGWAWRIGALYAMLLTQWLVVWMIMR